MFKANIWQRIDDERQVMANACMAFRGQVNKYRQKDT